MNIIDAKNNGMNKIKPPLPRIAVGLGTCGIGNGALALYEEIEKNIRDENQKILLTRTGCFGYCSQEPLVNILLPGKPLLILKQLSAKDGPAIVRAVSQEDIHSLKKYALCKISRWDHHTSQIRYCEESVADELTSIPYWNEIPFFKWQKKIVLRNCGIINPEDLEEYIAVGGYESLMMVLKDKSPEEVIEELKIANLRGRGGAGFPIWKKWDIMKSVQGNKKYIICNADEGDPGAYMNRNELESDPHMIIEGMLLGAFAMQADEGIIYIRAEYPLAVERIKQAIIQAEKAGFLGNNILGTDFNFHLNIVEGAGAFVCGEETALISSIEGKAGRPKPRPPYPAQSGLWGKPTTINNVETWANIPVIMAKGGSWFTETGTEKSTGTKVFSLVGKITNTGLVELPLGESIDTIVSKIGGGCEKNKKIKAVQTGGPSGGCIPEHLFHTPIDYESLTALGSIMGSGGMVVMDNDNCMVDVAKYFMEFLKSESCGKCTPCREGLSQLHKILSRITKGEGEKDDITLLEDLARLLEDTALCGLGKTAANPVLSTLKYFKTIYITHIKDKKCPAGECKGLFRYKIDSKACVGCLVCLKNCPVKAITGERKQPHMINQEICTICGVCFNKCRFNAVLKV